MEGQRVEGLHKTAKEGSFPISRNCIDLSFHHVSTNSQQLGDGGALNSKQPLPPVTLPVLVLFSLCITDSGTLQIAYLLWGRPIRDRR